MPIVLEGAEYEPDDNSSFVEYLNQLFAGYDGPEAVTRTLRVQAAAPFAGAPSLGEYPVFLHYPN